MTTAPTTTKKTVNPALLMKIATATATSIRRPNFRDGIYVVEIRALLSEQKRKGHCFIIETGIITAKESDDPSRPGIIPNAPGTIAGVVTNLDTNDSAPGNIKRFILGLLGVDEDTMAHDSGALMTAEEKIAQIMATYADIVSESQPARGMLVYATTYHSIIKSGPNQGKVFVGVNWDNYPNQTDEMIAQRRQLIDGGAIGSPSPI